MAYRHTTRRGFGDSTVPPNFCDTRWAWTNPACWNFTRGAIYGDNYPAPPMPTTVGSTLPDGTPIPAVPPVLASPQLTGVNAGQIVQSISDQQIADTQAQNQQFFENLNEQLNPPDPTKSGINWWLWGGIAAGAVVLVSVSTSGPRRYGR